MESALMPQHICGRMTMEKLRKTIRGVPTFYGIYEDLKPEVMTYGGRSWNQDTTEQYDQIVKDYILPYLDDSNRKHIGEICRDDYKKAIRRLIKRGKKGPGEPYEPWEKTGVPEKADYLMRAVVWTAWKHELCENWFDEDAQSTDSGARRKLAKEWVRIKKCLSIKQELSVVDYLMAIIYISGTAIGLLLQFALGLRNNEACGLNFGYIREYENYPGHYYLIIPQSTDLGASTVKILGKTKNSGRRIPLPKSLVTILFKLQSLRVAEANRLGYQGLAEDLPIVCKLGRPWERCGSGDLSNAARTMFNRIGMRNDELVALNQELLEDAQAAREELDEDEFREIESDPTAYLLRRNFATHLAKLRLKDVEIWYVIGHKIEDAYVQRRAFNDEKLLFALKLKLDERPVLNPIMLEKHVGLKPGESIQMDTSKRIKMEIPVEQVSKASIHVTAHEPGDHIHMKVTPKLTKGSAVCDYTSHAVPLPAEPDRTIDGTRAYLEAYHKAGAKETTDNS